MSTFSKSALMVALWLALGVWHPLEARELTGVYSPAPTTPLSPGEAVKSFTLPAGYEMRLFAAEPDVINPVAMTWDHQGRLWVIELFEYPTGAKDGEKPRDKIKVLEDTDGDGKADKVTVFADGLNLATGLALGNGGVYVGQAPHLLFLQDFDGDDVADTREIILTGFGMEDRHELLNGFQWGPDGWLYMTHGVFTHSRVVNPANADAQGVTMNAALGRFHPITREFEVFADGTSNPWGIDFDEYGNAFVSACVIDHLFHLAPGGLYSRQAGTPEFPYGYELLPSIVDHKHFRAAYSGVQVYQGNSYPADMHGKIFMGNIHHNAIHQDTLKPVGSSFIASEEREFIKSSDGWFRPVATRTGPDGNLWIMDWYDKYPCYQNALANPDGVDREHGRIWRVVYSGDNPDKKFPVLPAGIYLDIDTSYVLGYLKHPNNWVRRAARQVLVQRREPSTRSTLEETARNGSSVGIQLEALWTLHGINILTESFLDELAGADFHPAVRAWTARLTGERKVLNDSASQRLTTLASTKDPIIQSAVATALRQFVSGSLTLNTPPDQDPDINLLGPVFEALLLHGRATTDRTFKFQLWMAAEPITMASTQNSLNWFLDNGEDSMPLSGDILYRIMRRICDSRDASKLNEAVAFLQSYENTDSNLLAQSLQGLIDGQKSRSIIPQSATGPLIEKLLQSNNQTVQARARELGTLWGDAAALAQLLARIKDGSSNDDDRLKAIAVARQLRNDSAREALLSLAHPGSSPKILLETIAALGEVGGDSVAPHLLNQWKNLPVAARIATAQLMVTRWEWSVALVDSIRSAQVPASEVPAAVIRNLVNHKNTWLRDRAREGVGTFTDPNEDRLAVLDQKRAIVIAGQPNLENGRELAESTCLICHKFNGKGQSVGPDLTGVGRSSLDALLANIIMPNQIVGNGYELVVVETKDFRTLSGRLIENSPNRITLIQAGGSTTSIERDEIQSMETTNQSVMPEGLESLPDQDLRDLIWYILSPPEEGPLTDEKKKNLIGLHIQSPPIDGESVALWDPAWQVIAPDFEGTPAKLPNHLGRQNVLSIHPWNLQKPAALQRIVTLPQAKRSLLELEVAAHEKGDWLLKIFVNDQPIHEQLIAPKPDGSFHSVSVDLTDYAGQKIVLFCSHIANDWHYEFSYWASARVVSREFENLSPASLQAAGTPR